MSRGGGRLGEPDHQPDGMGATGSGPPASPDEAAQWLQVTAREDQGSAAPSRSQGSSKPQAQLPWLPRELG